MPSTVRLRDGGLLTAVRCREGGHSWISIWRSGDSGKNWSLLGDKAAQTGTRGNPASLLLLTDARLALIYGYRIEPYGIRARLSDDDGQSWSDEIILRQDGSSWDLGYPVSVQRPDGKIVTVYYYTDKEHGPERYIAATIWDPSLSMAGRKAN